MIALTIFLAEAINSSEAMRPDEYQNCLDMLQTLSMSPLAVNEDNIQCFEVQANRNSQYAKLLASYYAFERNDKIKAKFYFEKVVAINDDAEYIIDYYLYLIEEDTDGILDYRLKYSYLLEQAYNIVGPNSGLAAYILFNVYHDKAMQIKADEWRHKAKLKCIPATVIYEMRNAESPEERLYWRFVNNIGNAGENDLVSEFSKHKNFNFNKFLEYSLKYRCEFY
jgi:hypothetical protein